MDHRPKLAFTERDELLRQISLMRISEWFAGEFGRLGADLVGYTPNPDEPYPWPPRLPWPWPWPWPWPGPLPRPWESLVIESVIGLQEGMHAELNRVMYEQLTDLRDQLGSVLDQQIEELGRQR